MQALYFEFRNAGWVAWLILLVGIGAVPVCLLAIVLTATRSRHAIYGGAAALLVGSFAAGLGAGGVLLGWRTVNAATAGESVTPIQKERIRRIGYSESRSAAHVGLFFAALPLLVGTAATLIAIGRRRKQPAPPANPVAWGGGPPGVSPPTATEGGLAFPSVAFALGVVTVGSAFVLLKSPLPGRDLDPEDSTWQLLEAIDTVESGDLERGCRMLDESFGHARVRPGEELLYADPAKVPTYPAAAARCIDRDIKEGLALESPSQKRAKLASLLEPSRYVKPDDAQKRRIEEELARIPKSEPGFGVPFGDALGGDPSRPRPGIRMGSVTVAGRLPPEVIQRIVRQNFGRFRLCYEVGLKEKPDLQGRVAVKFVIGRDGSILGAPSDGGSDLPDKSVVSCVVRGFANLTFPAPEGGIVTVVFPIVFVPPGASPAASASAP